MLTAAHCLEFANKTDLAVVVGDHDLSDPNDGQQKFSVSNVIIYPGFEDFESTDFAVIELEGSVNLRPEVGIACLPMNTSETFIGADLIATGWGQTQSGNDANVLKAMRTEGISLEECSRLWQEEFSEHDQDKLCVFNSKDAPGQGDSGGISISIIGIIKNVPRCSIGDPLLI